LTAAILIGNAIADETSAIGSLPTEKVLSHTDIIHYFTGRFTTWSDGTEVTIVLLPRDNPVTRKFIFEQLGMSPTQYFNSLIINTSIKGKDHVVYVNTERDMVTKVRYTPGSIGFISNGMLYNAPNRGVFLIQVR
jgi:hypothetical protein